MYIAYFKGSLMKVNGTSVHSCVRTYLRTYTHVQKKLIKMLKLGGAEPPPDPPLGGGSGRRNTKHFWKMGSTGRTDLRIGQSEAKLHAESFGEV